MKQHMHTQEYWSIERNCDVRLERLCFTAD